MQAGKGRKIFYDWFKHNHVEDYVKALAVSCNVSFAKMGISVGLKRHKEMLDKFLFNTGNLTDRFFTFGTGVYNDKISDEFQLANLSVGLEEIKSTTLHSALISAIISQNGSVYSPYVIKNVRNLLDLGFFNHDPKIIKTFKNSTDFIKIKEAMIEVVEMKRGTGRRSRVDFMRTAVKTGSAGDSKKGLDAILLGFFPARKPVYAFAFRLERAGRADLKGARFLKQFLISLYNKE